MQKYSIRQLAVATTALAFAFAAWDATGLDVALAHLSGSRAGFPLRDNALLYNVIHEGGRRLAWLAAVALCIGVWWPFGWLTRLSGSQRLQLAVTTLLALFAVSAIKSLTGISCPWDEVQFGGSARHASHWVRMFQADGGSGRCFPAGHASGGFAFIAGWFAFRNVDRQVARRWLAAALATGFLFGVAQQLRGAHYMSHTLWTLWLCWATALAMEAGWNTLYRRLDATPQAGAMT